MTNVPIKSQWAASLQLATYNGIPFNTDGTTYTTGRRVAVHSYPFRDNPWVEDLGLATRSVQFTGFLVGDDVYSQRDSLKRACETGGQGTLIHPSMGTIQASLVQASFGETADKGRMVEVQFQFVVTDTKPRWPDSQVDTQAATQNAASALNSASSGDFFQQVGSALQQGTSAIGGVLQSARQFVGQVTGVVRDAAGIVGSVTGGLGLGGFGIGGVLGRFTSGLGAVNGVLSGLSNINTRLNGFGGFLSSGLSGFVPNGITGLATFHLAQTYPPSFVVGGNLGTLTSLQGVANVITSNSNAITNFVAANTSQFTGILSQGVSVAQQMSQQVGSVINQTTAVRGLLSDAADSVNNIASQL